MDRFAKPLFLCARPEARLWSGVTSDHLLKSRYVIGLKSFRVVVLGALVLLEVDGNCLIFHRIT